MKDKRISDIAKELGVSRQAIYKRVNKTLTTELTPYVYKDKNGTTLIKPKGVAIIKDSFLSTELSTLTESLTPSLTPGLQDELIKFMKDQLATLQDQLSLMNSQLAAKDNQILAKDQQIDKLSQLVENQQVLLKAEQEKGQLLIESTSNTNPKGLKKWFSTKRS